MLNALADAEVSSQPALWTMLVALSKAFPGAFILHQKSVWPKILAALRAGMRGGGAIAYQAFVSVLGNVPAELVVGQHAQDLLDALWQGLDSKTLLDNDRALVEALAATASLLLSRGGAAEHAIVTAWWAHLSGVLLEMQNRGSNILVALKDAFVADPVMVCCVLFRFAVTDDAWRSVKCTRKWLHSFFAPLCHSLVHRRLCLTSGLWPGWSRRTARTPSPACLSPSALVVDCFISVALTQRC